MFDKIRNALKKTISSVKENVKEAVLTSEKFEDIFWDLELELIKSNVSPEIISIIKKELSNDLVGKKLERSGIESVVRNGFSRILDEAVRTEDFLSLVKKSSRPVKVMFVGFNGAGKTTSLAKIADLLVRNGLSCVIAACDTFRAASIEQLGEHAQKLGIRMIKSQYGSDSSAVAFDAIKHAQSKGVDCVLIDVAGRSHENVNLMNELHKMRRVVDPDITVLVIDALTGSDSVNQARRFDEIVPVTGIIVSKTDSDQGGGTVISVSYALKKPVFFLGTGQDYSDLEIPSAKNLISRIL